VEETDFFRLGMLMGGVPEEIGLSLWSQRVIRLR
jgi:hypothetical protein